jgi:actin-like ATPase involved in cell morphogenesis
MTAHLRHRLAVDLGTSTTIAMLQWSDGRIRPLLFDGSPLLASAVLLGPDGRLQTGRDAAHLARRNPERLEPNPKRRVDDDVVLLGESAVPVRDLLAAVLGRVATEAGRVAGQIGQLTLTHPAAWGQRRVALLTDAAQRVGLPRPSLIGEPLAAATYFAHTMGPALPLGSLVLVYDLGAGTCDITLLRRQPHGFDIVASDGLNDVGGLDIDAAIVAFLEASHGTLWTDAVNRRQLWEDVRTAKEMLSRTTQTLVTIPSLGTEVPLGREQFNGLIAPVLRPTISMTRSLLLDANTAHAPTTVVVLVGGASRVPLVATMLHEALNLPPVVIEQPELVVAEGALHATAPGPAPDSTPSGGFPLTAAPVSGGGGPAGPVSGGLIPVSGGFMAVGGTTTTPAPIPVAPVSTVYSRPVAPSHSPADNGQRTGSRRTNAALILAGVVAVLLVLGFGTTGVIWYTGWSGGTANPTTSATASPGTDTNKAKYNVEAMFPKDFNMCQKADLGRLATSFDKQLSAPLPQTLLANNISTASCTFARQRGGADLNLTITASIYGDPNIATSQQQTARLNAKQADPAFKTITDVGDEAVLYRNQASDPSAPGKQAYYTESIRDGNLILTGTVIANKTNGADWSPTERNQITDDLQAAAKSTLRKLIGA